MPASATVEPVLLVHGGAGIIRHDLRDPARNRAARVSLAEALKRGHALLAAGGSALDAVTEAVAVLEDAPYFNAGRGSVFSHEGVNEMDAAVMVGHNRHAGAVAGVHRIRNPVRLARVVMEHSPHVMLAGAGAEAFAVEQGIELVDPAYFHTEARWQALQDALRHEASTQPDADHYGTVGAVALDRYGHLAVATSTGGMTNKRWNRIGDSPLIGAGTYANAACAMSGTGWGEFYIRTAAAHAVCLRVAEMGHSVAEAAEQVINRDIPALGGDGGAIVLGADGRFAMPFNTDGMYRGWIGADGVARVAVLADEDVGLVR